MVEARLNREYALRIAGVGALMLGICLWSLYDGHVVWPRHNAAVAAVRGDLLAETLSADAWIAVGGRALSPLQAIFARRQLNPPAKLIRKLGELRLPASAEDQEERVTAQQEHIQKLFTEPLYSARDLASQDVQAGITLVLTLLAFGSLGIKACRRYRATPAGVTISGFGGGTFAYSEMERIDWRKWDEKGIAIVLFRNGRRVTLDSWHYADIPALVDEIRRQRPDLASRAKPRGCV